MKDLICLSNTMTDVIAILRIQYSSIFLGVFRSSLWMWTHFQMEANFIHSDLNLFSMEICRIYYAKAQRSTNFLWFVHTYFVYQFQFKWKIVDLFINKPNDLIFRIAKQVLFTVHFVSCNLTKNNNILLRHWFIQSNLHGWHR